ncbi:unnamed protein product [Caenorhabditis angaria]|uniref:Uncharacterized protein n=1 Tax=Caenorhabditis angaria TaxID=860376 RepID=A0A9P1IYK1_9PELO|nr:unnamed protein product [Caenorhabditis angaria]
MEYWYEILAIISWILSTFLIIFFRKFYKSCSRIIAFFTLKILIDWFIFEGIVKFPGDGDSFKCRIMADCVYLMFTNIIYIQVFFSDYKLDPAFFGISLALTIMSAIIGIFFTMQSDWDKTSLCLVPLIEHDNELNTISECSSINSNLSLDMQNTTTPRDMKVYTVSEEVQKKKSSRLSKISRNLNKVGSEDTTSNRSSNRV